MARASPPPWAPVAPTTAITTLDAARILARLRRRGGVALVEVDHPQVMVVLSLKVLPSTGTYCRSAEER